MKKIFALSTAAVIATAPALAGPYVNLETNQKFDTGDYTSTLTEAHIGWETQAGKVQQVLYPRWSGHQIRGRWRQPVSCFWKNGYQVCSDGTTQCIWRVESIHGRRIQLRYLGCRRKIRPQIFILT